MTKAIVTKPIHFYSLSEDPDEQTHEVCCCEDRIRPEDGILHDGQQYLQSEVHKVSCVGCLQWIAYHYQCMLSNLEGAHKDLEKAQFETKCLIRSWREGAREGKDFETADGMTKWLEAQPQRRS